MAWGHVPEPGGWHFYAFAEENRSAPKTKLRRIALFLGWKGSMKVRLNKIILQKRHLE